MKCIKVKHVRLKHSSVRNIFNKTDVQDKYYASILCSILLITFISSRIYFFFAVNYLRNNMLQ